MKVKQVRGTEGGAATVAAMTEPDPAAPVPSESIRRRNATLLGFVQAQAEELQTALAQAQAAASNRRRAVGIAFVSGFVSGLVAAAGAVQWLGGL